MGLAAAVLYLSCINTGERIFQRDVATADDVTKVTIRNRIKGFKVVGSVEIITNEKRLVIICVL